MLELFRLDLEQKIQGIPHFYIYHQVQVSPTQIEFGWVNSMTAINVMQGPIVMAKDPLDPSWDSLSTLADYGKFFKSLTGLDAKSFIEKWGQSPKEFQIFWKSKFPNAPEDQFEFIIQTAKLIADGQSFEMYGKTYQVLKLIGESNGQGGNQS